MALAEHFRQNRRPVIISRGYKRRNSKSVHIVSNGREILCPPQEAGDEPYLLAMKLKGCPVIVGGDRLEATRLAESELKPEMFLLDDAFQHLRIERDVDILLVSEGLGFDTFYPTREPIRQALRRAHCICVKPKITNTVNPQYKEYLKRTAPQAAIFWSRLKETTYYSFPEKEILDVELLREGNLFAFAGIAHNQVFFDSLIVKGIPLTGTRSFSDHHWYSESDLEGLNKDAKRAMATGFITTEKDLVRLLGCSDIPLQKKLVVVSVKYDYPSVEDGEKNLVAYVEEFI